MGNQNLFIDTNILYDDPFFKGLNKFLLDWQADGKINIYVSDIVISELIETYKGRIKKIIDEYKKSKSQLRKLSNTILDNPKIEKEILTKELNEFYHQLEFDSKITVVKTKDEILTPVLQMALKKELPFFFNGKNEFKDAFIAFSYAHFARKKKLTNCCLITNNIRDFADTKGAIHPNISDIHPFSLIGDINDLRTSSIQQAESQHGQINKVIEGTDEKRIKNILFEKNDRLLFEELEIAIENKFNVSDFSIDDPINRPLIQLSRYKFKSIESISHDFETNLQSYYGTIFLEIFIEIYDKSPRRIENFRSLKYYGEISRDIKLNFELTVNTFDYIQHFDISNVSFAWSGGDDLPF